MAKRRRTDAAALLILTCWITMVRAQTQAPTQSRTYVAYVGSYDAGTVYNLNDMVSSGESFYILASAGECRERASDERLRLGTDEYRAGHSRTSGATGRGRR